MLRVTVEVEHDGTPYILGFDLTKEQESKTLTREIYKKCFNACGFSLLRKLEELELFNDSQ